MKKQVVKIEIDEKGNFSFEAVEGFEGKLCREQTKQLELALGGIVDDTENTKDYYKNPNKLNLKL